MMTRNQFLAAMAGSLAVKGRGATPPNSRIHIGIIGSGARGIFEAAWWAPLDACEVTAVCDVQETRRLEAKAALEKLYREHERPRRGIAIFRDYRELLERKEIDAVYIATPDHWHVTILVAALKAGKACHCEKPLGVSIEQEQAALRAVKRYGRPFFYGAERRSTPDARHAVELVLNGRIGEVQQVVVASPGSLSGGSATPAPVPKGFDWDMWLGPAPEAPYCPDRLEGRFHIRDYSLGFIANWGIHPLDQFQWWADNAGLTVPVTYQGTGRIASGGLYDCATSWDIRCTYANGLEMRYVDGRTFNSRPDLPRIPLGPPGKRGHNAVVFVGTEGTVAIAYDRVATAPASLAGSELAPGAIRLVRSPERDEARAGKNVWAYPAAAHQRAWIECLAENRPPVHTIETAVRSGLIAHLSDICIRTGRTIRWDERKGTITGDPEAAKMISRPMRKPWDEIA